MKYLKTYEMKHLKYFELTTEKVIPKIGDYILMNQTTLFHHDFINTNKFLKYVTNNIGEIIKKESPSIYIIKYNDKVPGTSGTDQNTIRAHPEEFKFSTNKLELETIILSQKFNI